MNRDTSRTGPSETVLAQLREVFAATPGVERVVLFGSRAKGNARTGSDIDLAVMGQGLGSRDLADLDNRLDDLLLPYKIDLVLYEHIDNQDLREHIERVGIVLFASENGSAQ